MFSSLSYIGFNNQRKHPKDGLCYKTIFLLLPIQTEIENDNIMIIVYLLLYEQSFWQITINPLGYSATYAVLFNHINIL